MFYLLLILNILFFSGKFVIQFIKAVQMLSCHYYASSLGQSHASTYRRSLAVSSTTISYPAYVVIFGVCLRFKPHWMFQIYKYVIKGREELTFCWSLMHSFLFPLLDVSYRQVGNLSFWTVRCAEFVIASNHIVAAIQGAGDTMPSVLEERAARGLTRDYALVLV